MEDTPTTPPDDYKISLEVFEGPLDLLLYLIRRDELDIYDLPIERIAVLARIRPRNPHDVSPAVRTEGRRRGPVPRARRFGSCNEQRPRRPEERLQRLA